MEDAYHPYTPTPYGWWTVAAAVVRWIIRSVPLNPGLKDERAAALEFLDAPGAPPRAR